jgi:hypothetical protein
MTDDQLVALLGSVLLPLIFVIALSIAESLVARRALWEHAKDVGWDMCVLGIGLIGGLFSDKEFTAHYGRFSSVLTALVIALDLLFCVIILWFKKRHRKSVTCGRIAIGLGLLAVAIPSGVLIWRF